MIHHAGVQAFRDSPVTYSSEDRLYRRSAGGEHLELFFLDERSLRSAKLTQICGGDLAPRGAQRIRDPRAWASQSCLARLSLRWEVVTGPVATNTFAKEIDGFLGQKGAGTATARSSSPHRRTGRCAALDSYSHAQVAVTARRLTVAVKDAKGLPVREATGVACAPLVLTAR